MTEVQPLSAEELTKERGLHHEVDGMCTSCVDGPETDYAPTDWPCETGRWLATIDQQAETIRKLKAALAEERRKFQAETLRTSALTQLLIRAEAVLCPEHEPGAWSRTCERCAVVADSRKLRATPINAAALTSTEAPAPSTIHESWRASKNYGLPADPIRTPPHA